MGRLAPTFDPATIQGVAAAWDGVTLDRLGPSPATGPLAALVAGRAGPGEAVVWQCANGPEAVELYRACWAAGAVAVPLHHRAGPGEVERALEVVDPALVLAGSDVALAGHPGAMLLDRLPPEVGAPARPGPGPDDLAVALFTSGTSGTPKLVLHCHRSLAYKARQMAAVHGLGPGDVVLMPAPLAHVSGLLNGVLVPAAAGMDVVLMARWDPGEAAALVERHRVTFMVGPPTFFTDLADHARPGQLESLRLVSCGGAGVTATVVERLADALGAVVKRTYGSTEVPTVATTGPDDPAEARAGTDGWVLPPAEARVGDDGGLWLRGPEMFAGYADAAATAAAVDGDGWFRTGDRARFRADGALEVLGRADDLIIRAGENIDPAAVEGALVTLDGVRAAVAVGVPDARLGQRVGAVVEAGRPLTLDEARRGCEDRGLARFALPEAVATVDRLPRLASGKPDRSAAVALLAGGPGAGAGPGTGGGA